MSHFSTHDTWIALLLIVGPIVAFAFWWKATSPQPADAYEVRARSHRCDGIGPDFRCRVDGEPWPCRAVQHVEGQRPHLPMPGFDPEEVA